jgi:exopolyphosphatase/guanosine-5'-triphosphate,3'-diphosphate pyrophosphatase
MLIADIDPVNLKITTVLDTQKIPRLGRGVDSNKYITKDSIRTAIKILNEFKSISNNYNSEKIIASATSFLRDAKNKDEFISEIKKNSGIDIEELSGNDEAKWSFWGVVSEQLSINNEQIILTIDIGGGSTEITSAYIQIKNNLKNTIEKTEINTNSIDIGSVRINEKFLKHQPPFSEELEEAEKFIIKNIESLTFNLIKDNCVLIGLAGTITTLGALKLNLKTFNKEKIDGLILTSEDVKNLFHNFTISPLQHLLSLGEYMQGRADIILPGAMILKYIMERLGLDEIKISTKGLRYGLLLRELIKH